MTTNLEALVRALPAGRVLLDEPARRERASDLWPRGLIAARDGAAGPAPAAVVLPESEDEVVRAVRWARERRGRLIARGGGAGVLGAAAVTSAHDVVLDLSRMTRIETPDAVDCTVRTQPGVVGADLEAALEARGLTWGHYPQSLPVSTVGGFLATRSSGQASTRYGNIEDLVVGLHAVLGTGEVLVTRASPRTSAGPSLAELLLGSEGTLGIVTEATLRVFPAPPTRAFASFAFDGFAEALRACRAVVQGGGRPAVLRVHDEQDAALSLASQGVPVPDETGALLIATLEGPPELAAAEEAFLARECASAGGRDLGPECALAWWRTRYSKGERLREIVEGGGIAETLEVVSPWSRALATRDAVRAAVANDDTLVLCHASHFYVDGAALYFTFVGAGGVAEHERIWRGALRAAHEAGAGIAHHHGVGLARLAEAEEEAGAVGVAVWRRLKTALDPDGVLNPGKIGRTSA